MAQSIESLQPPLVWQIFAGMAAVPRPSKHEERIRAHVKQFAESKGLKVREEQIGNLIIEVPATKGHDSAPITVLQGHLDMVCEKNSGTAHDFDKEGIKLLIDKEQKTGEPIVRADGTTLGADNGMGVALALAAALDPAVVHGPLEILLTIDEEAGMSGAKALTPQSFKGRRMINLDSEEDDAIYIGCAGGCDTNLTWRLGLSAKGDSAESCRVIVEGLRGGHSGGDIHQGRGNAIKLLGRVLSRIGSDGLRIASIVGGSKRNAIPREAHAELLGPGGITAQLQKAASAIEQEAKADSFEPQVRIRVEKAEIDKAASAEQSAALLAAIAALPSGVLGMHPKVPELVQTSNNVSTVETKPAGGTIDVVIGCLSRSSSNSRLDETKRQLAAIGILAGATIEIGNEYPGWEPDLDSPTLAKCKGVYERLFGHPPKVLAIHAGLECGIIGQRVGKMDMVSFGPHITGAHSPDELVYVNSVAKSWKYLQSVLAELA